MKLKTRLVIAFCIIIILPIGLAGAAILGLYRIQTKAIQKNYGLEASDTQGVLSNSLQLMSVIPKRNMMRSASWQSQIRRNWSRKVI